MANHWTKEQQRAIDRSGRNILVSAAAGSGKTAVLVERIIKKITDDNNPVDIDRMVVVTFTKAAAAEMKQRIRESIDSILEKEPDNARLQRQLTLINNAQITTIDSFCLNIIRNYFTDIDLDPGFRTADEGEIQLMEHDVMEEMLEYYYSSGDSDFFDFIDAYGTGRNDENVEEIILQLYRFARSSPWVDEWFDEIIQFYNISNKSELEDNKAVIYLKEYVIKRMKDYDKKYFELEKICEGPLGPSMYTQAIQSDHSAISRIVKAKSFEEISKFIDVMSFEKLGTKRVSDVSEKNKTYVKEQRDKYKDFVVKTLKGRIFTKDIDGLIKDIKDNKKSVAMMIKLARDFTERMAIEKRERNIIDFNDMEHMALDVLVQKENGVKKYTEASDILSEYYSEILIDEYQDSNMLQEEILTAVSKGRYDEELNNVYMVGDVKQSIYRFRMACPYLFMKKYESYTGENIESPNEKIELQANFRSRKNVLDCVNDVFKRAMNYEYTGVSYDEKAMLNAGFDYDSVKADEADKSDVLNKENVIQNCDFGMDPDTEVMVISIDEEDDESASPKIVQAKAIANKINELVNSDDNNYMVYDKKSSTGYRKIKYSDIVILLRTVTGWADTFADEIMNEGIPAYCDTSTGYFNVREIKLMLNYLAVLDNPLQDIEISAVMLSYFGGFDTNELAVIRMMDKNKNLYHIMKDEECLNKLEESLKNKINVFTSKVDEYRFKSEIMSIYSLLWDVLYNTGYYDYVGTMPAGKARQANLDLLLERASAFEKTSYNGLFNFLRYVERMQQYDVDFGEASSLGEHEDLVRIMSIHKSKGLEFPVVFLAGMNKKINLMDAAGEVVIDQNYGIGTNIVNLNKRIKSPTCIKAAVSMKIKQESISEELRVLYVAMTRAREKLIMTGTVTAKSLEKKLEKWQEKAMEVSISDNYSYSDVAEFSNYFDIVMPVAYLEKEKNVGSFKVVCKRNTKQTEDTVSDINADINKDINKDINVQADINTPADTEKLVEVGEAAVAREPLPEYPYSSQTVTKSKVTVSELKKMQADADMDYDSMVADDVKESVEKEKADNTETEEYIPQFIKDSKEVLAGNERGTAYHRIMECLNYSKTGSVEEVKGDILSMVSEEKITQVQKDSVNVSDIYDFIQTETGARAKVAWENGQLYRESPFVYYDKETQMLVQGVIDMYFKENNEITIVDYKTDRVKKGQSGREELIKRYKVQLDYYAKALEQLTDLKVKDRIIYSFQLGEDIHL